MSRKAHENIRQNYQSLLRARNSINLVLNKFTSCFFLFSWTGSKIFVLLIPLFTSTFLVSFFFREILSCSFTTEDHQRISFCYSRCSRIPTYLFFALLRNNGLFQRKTRECTCLWYYHFGYCIHIFFEFVDLALKSSSTSIW